MLIIFTDPVISFNHLFNPLAISKTKENIYVSYFVLGNYLLVVYDMVVLGEGVTADPYQIGAISAIGDDFLRLVNVAIF